MKKLFLFLMLSLSIITQAQDWPIKNTNDTTVWLSCIDSSQIDVSICCLTVLDPVCGCDSVTYQNACIAQFYYGVSAYYAGSCVTAALQQYEINSMGVYPNPFQESIQIRGVVNEIQVYNLEGRRVAEAHFADQECTHQVDLNSLPQGIYLLQIDGHQVTRLVKN
ncbi:MAG: hypothetical protein RLZZ301_1209 [Bacteroidota bacterium]|jgi:hypothetical protein